MTVLQQSSYEGFICLVIEKLPGKEKRGRAFFFLQYCGNEVASICKFMAGKDQCDLLFCAVAPDDTSLKETVPSSRDYCFFTSASFAASRYTSEAVPSMVGSFVL